MKKRLLSFAMVIATCIAFCTSNAEARGDSSGAAHVSPISAGVGFFAVIDESGSLWMWGQNGFGQLGNGGTGDSTYTVHNSYWGISENVRPCQTTPVKVLDNVVAVSCGNDHTAAIKEDGSLWMWGLNDRGQLGNGGQGNAICKEPIAAAPGTERPYNSIPYQTVPIKVMDGVVAVSCGTGFTGAITSDGTLWMWGNNNDGQLGTGKLNTGDDTLLLTSKQSTTPIKVLTDVTAVSCGHDCTAAIRKDSTLWMWGKNVSGQLGNGGGGNATKQQQRLSDSSCSGRGGCHVCQLWK